MWLSFLIGLNYDGGFSQFGIYPREVKSLLGIITAPFVHGDWEHLFFNSTSFLVLTIMLFYFYEKVASKVFIFSFLLTGLLVWIFARPSYHIGMSGVIYAEFGFLFFAGFLSKNRMQIVVSLITAMFYGSMVWGVFPGKAGVSWESHLYGFLIGIASIFIFNRESLMENRGIKRSKEIDEYMIFDVEKRENSPH